MLEIIPAIDIIQGKCVRLYQGNYDQKTVYNEDPVAVAKSFEIAGIKRLHLVDLDGAKAGQIINLNVLKSIAGETNLIIDFGGGVQSDDDIKKAFDNGAEMITAGSIAVKNKPLVCSWLAKYGTSRIILGADVKEKKICISGWEENSGLGIFGLLDEYINEGISHVICTDISKDGAMKGPSFKLYNEILQKYPGLKLIASGGISSMQDLLELEKNKMHGAIIGKALYENKISLYELGLKNNCN